MQLHLRKFDPSVLTCDKVMIFIGKRNTGKSFLVRDILYYLRDVPIGTVISPTEQANPYYGKLVPSLFIHDEYTPELVEKVLKRQKIVTKQIAKDNMMYGKSSIDPRAFLILDDCLYDGCWKRDKNIRFMFMNGRHVKLNLLITMQYILGVPPDLRTNVDYVFILRETNYGNRRKIYDNYAGVFPTFEIFCDVLNQLTDGYGCLVIDNTSKSNKLEDNVFWYIADDHPPFTVGSKAFWQMHNDHIAEGGDEDDEDVQFDVQAFRKKNKGPLLNVKKIH